MLDPNPARTIVRPPSQPDDVSAFAVLVFVLLGGAIGLALLALALLRLFGGAL